MLERPTQSLKPTTPTRPSSSTTRSSARDFCCPGCGVRLATEVAYPGEAPFHELRLD